MDSTEQDGNQAITKKQGIQGLNHSPKPDDEKIMTIEYEFCPWISYPSDENTQFNSTVAYEIHAPSNNNLMNVTQKGFFIAAT